MVKKRYVKLAIVIVACLLLVSVLGVFLFQYEGFQPSRKERPLFHEARKNLLKTFDKVEVGEKKTPKRKIDNENPLNLVNYYGEEPIEFFWNSIPESQRKFSILLIIPSHVFLPEDEQTMKNMEQYADTCEANQIPYVIQNTMGETFMEELQPIAYLEERFAKRHKYFYGLSAAELYNGINWRGDADSDMTRYINQAVAMCAKYGAFFIWTDTNMRYENGMIIDWFENNESLYSTFKNYSQYIYMLNKDTSAIFSKKTILPAASTFSVMQGLWLAGLIAGWGVACDWWSFCINQIDGKSSLFHEYDEYIDHYSENGFSFPENLFIQEYAYVASRGGVCFKAEAPNMSMTVDGKAVPGFQYAMMPFLDSLVNGRINIPTREQVLQDTPAVVVGGKNYFNFHYNTKESYRFSNVGAPIIPLLPGNLRLAERAEFESRGISIIEKKLNQAEFNNIFKPIESNTYATRTADQWYYINNVDNARIRKQAKMVPVINSAQYFEIDAAEHTWAIIKEKSDRLEFNINNYRTDKSSLLKGVTADSGPSWVDISRKYLTLDENGNPKYLDDSVKRNTTIKIKGTYNSGAPEVVFNNLQDGSGEYNRSFSPTISWDNANQILTISIEHNGRLEFDVLLDDSGKVLTLPEKNPISATVSQNSNSVDELIALTATPILDVENYTYYTYLCYERALHKAYTIIQEKTYSTKEIKSAAKELKKAEGNLIRVDKTVEILRKVLEVNKSDYTEESYNALMTQYDRTLRELLASKYYVSDKANRTYLGFSRLYAKLEYSKLQHFRKKNAIEKQHKLIQQAYDNLKPIA